MYRANELTNGPSADNSVVPHHTLVTRYRYNTLNQVISQRSPDAGVSKFWYDALGRLVVSQNAQQALDNKYSYTEYDILGRIAQVGQKPQATAMTQAISRNPATLNSWLTASQNKEQVTRTVYDISYYAGEQPGTLEPTLYQKNLRNRVSYTQVFDTEPAGTSSGKWSGMHTAATYYSYDIHGNVDTLLQDYKTGAMADAGNRFKKIVYNYDLISGKVNEVDYQPGQPDAFYHKYGYDAENRITDVETSRDKLVWEHDARYYYYKHGPLARTILGEQQVQGIDYAYTLQGWLKGVNSTAVGDGTFDMGQDGKIGGTNSNVARDAYGFALSYNNADYNAIYPLANSSLNPFATASAAGTGFNGLYNGNIAGMAVNIPKAGQPLLYTYTYDQLNRLTKMFTYNGLNPATNSWNASAINDYREQISYDANGNILTYKRNGDAARANGSGTGMDNLAYTYKPGTNQLDKVADAAPDAAAGEYDKYNDIKQGQQNGNYQYDAIGNLISDASEGITGITWTVYGKINTINKTGGITIHYSYDASGNRINKTENGKETWYIRDASGNVMSVYTKAAAINSAHLTQSEIHLYGSNRLGISNLSNDVEYPDLNKARIFTFTRGNKFFELSNHLGNVLATINDKKVGVDSNGDGLIDYYTAEVVSAQDYAPFGMGLAARKYSIANANYRYGFNGKENDNEVKGEGNQQDYGMRIYDPRLGRFLSVDPLGKSYPMLTPYQFASNTPIVAIDLDGLEAQLPKVIGTTYAKIKKLTSTEIEENLISLNVPGLSITFLKSLSKEEGLSLSMYDVDNKVEKLGTSAGRGGNTTIGFGHLVHYGAIGSTQYDKDALTKEEAYTDGKITIAEAFNILSNDLSNRMPGLKNSLSRNKITDAPQGVVDLFMDLIYNTGNANTAMDIYKKGGVFGLHIALKGVQLNSNSNKVIKNVSTARQKMRLELINQNLQEENIKKAADDPRESKPDKQAQNIDIALIRLSTGEYILKVSFQGKSFIVINS